MPRIETQTRNDKRKPSGVPSVIDRIRDIEKPERGIRMAMYGKSGSGKTTLACDFPKPLLFIRPPDDDGRQSVFNVEGIKDVDITDMDDLAVLAEHVQERGTVTVNGKKYTGGYKSVVVDNLSALQELAMAKVLGLKKVPAQLRWGTATQSQYGDVTSLMKEGIREILGCPSHVILLAQEREFNTEASSEDLLMPFVNCALTPSVTGWLGPTVDYLVNTFIRKGFKEITRKVGGKDLVTKVEKFEFCLRIGPHSVFNTKFRAPKGTEVPDVIVDPSYAKIAALIEGRPLPTK